MTTKKRFLAISAAALVLALGALGFLGMGSAVASDVEPIFIPGNPTCSTIGYDFGFKPQPEPPPSGTYTFPDGSNTVSITSDGTYFDWLSTLGIDAVIVKGGPNADAYVYFPESLGDTGLHAPINPNNNMPFAISHIEFCYDYELTATKTANATWYKTIDWTIQKDVTPEEAHKFIGQSATYDYTVTLTKDETFGPYIVAGIITVNNPTPYTVTFSVEDDVGGTAASVDCPSYTLSPWGSVNCTYEASLSGAIDGTNTATITSSTLGVGGATAVEDYAFGDPVLSDTSEPETITATDTLKGSLGSFSASATVNYSLTQDCSADPGDYAEDGIWSLNYPNTASINETTGDSSSEEVKLTCYAPVVSKDATATWYRDIEWTIEKDVTPAEAHKFIGESATYDYTVTLTKTETDTYFVSGTIQVSSPGGSPANMTVSLEDEIAAGVFATVDCGGGATSVTVAAGTTETCSYTGELAGKVDGTNTATGTFMDYDFAATYDYAFGEMEYAEGSEPEEVTATDTLKGALGSFSASATVNYSLTQDCSADPGDYAGDGIWSLNYPNTASINETTGDSSSEEVKLTCYAPVITKDADGSYDEYHDWEVDKSVDPAQQSAFLGEKVDFDWTVTVTEDVSEENFAVSGKIYVYNPAPAPMDMTVVLSDVLDDGTVATITGCSDTGVTWDGTNLYIPAGVTATCDYTAAPGGGPGLNNFANVLPGSVQFKVQYPVAGGEAYFPTVTVAGGTVLDGTYDGWCIDTDHTIANNTWYNANVFSSYEDMTGLVEKPQNMDLVNWILNQGFVYQTSPGCSGSYTYGDVQRAIWTLIEDNNSTSGLGSWSQCRVNEILAAAAANGEGFEPVCGDYIAVVFEPVSGAQVIAVSQVTMIEVGLECPAENTATATFNDFDFPASADIIWTKNVVHESVTLDDDQKPDWPVDISEGGTWTYTDPDGYTCSMDASLYEGDGTYRYEEENLATLYDGDEFLDDGYAKTIVDCYAPVVDKDAAGTYDETHTWDIEKEVTPLTQSGYPGEELPWTWTVTLSETYADSNFDLTGKIYVTNPNPDDDLTVDLSDTVNGTAATITGCTGGTFSEGTLLVPASSTATCDYELLDQEYGAVGSAPTSNTATATFKDVDFSKTVNFTWEANVINGTADVDDDQESEFPLTVNAGDGPWTWTETQSHVCSKDRADYGDSGSYGETVYNLATVTGSDGQYDESSASTEWLCEASFVNVYKTTNGEPADPDDDIQFVLYSYDGETPVEEDIVSTLNNGANLYFQTALVPGAKYTICEYPVPAAYTFEISVNGDNVLTYPGPPGEENPTGEIQCFDFFAELAGTTVTFDINNRYPGGAPRTPGYWKNWNRCSGGNQADTADKLNNYSGPVMGAGVYLLDDLLPQTLGNLTIETCQQGVWILSTYKLDGVTNMNSDAAYTLATALLAARLNQDAGACVVPIEETWQYNSKSDPLTFEQVLTAADGVLSGVGFDGNGDYLNPQTKDKALRALRSYALWLYGIIDDYNNSYLCDGDESH